MTARPAPASKNRNDIAAEYRWSFSDIYPSWEAWEAGLGEMEKKMGAFAALRGSLSQGGQALLKAYESFDEIGKLQYLVFRFVQLQRDVDTRDQAISGRYQRISAVFAKFDAATSWFAPELLQLKQSDVEGWISATPKLAPYTFPIIDLFRRQAHVLDEKGERLLALAGPLSAAPGSTYSELSTSDIRFPTITTSEGKEVKLTPASYSALLEGTDNQADRAKAAEAHLGTYGATINTYAAIYNGILQRDWFGAQARNFPNTLEAALEGDAIPVEVVETLIKVAKEGVEPLRRYVKLRMKLLKLESYHPYDGFVPVMRSSQKYPYDQARELALASTAMLGDDYVEKYKRFATGGRIDVYESEGKRSGAYQAGVYGVGPYLLLNHNDTLDSAFTLAHEGGHAMHTVLSHEAQPFTTSDYTIFVAEVASITNERLLLEYLLAKTSDAKERFLLLEHAVQSIAGTFYTQVLFADFELQAHRLIEQGQPATAEVLSDLYVGLLRGLYGDAMTVDDFYKYTWSRIGHFFNSPYYVYQYATCFASSAQLFHSMTNGSAEEKRAATERYLGLLRSGGNDLPMNQLKKAGVDLTQRATVQAVVEQMSELVTRMEKEAALIG